MQASQSVQEAALIPVSGAAALERFATLDVLTVRQKTKLLEIVTDLQLRQRYEVFDQFERAVLEVEERDTSLRGAIVRVLLGSRRPFSAAVWDKDTGDVYLRLERPFRFLFPQLNVYAGTGERLGSIEHEPTWFRRKYLIFGPRREVLGSIVGPLRHLWTFEIHADGQHVGTITKKWSGLLKEIFTDLDNFGVDMRAVDEPILRALLFAATVLIDVVYFEDDG